MPHLLNAIQHRNGPNQRPPNSIYGNFDSPPQLLSNHLICGVLGAIICGAALITILNLSLKGNHEIKRSYEIKDNDELKDNHESSTYGLGVLTYLFVAIFVLMILMTGMFLMRLRRKMQHDGVCIEPNCPEFESDDNLVFTNVTPNVDVIEKPPSYDYAVKIPTTKRKSVDSLPPSYDKINVVV